MADRVIQESARTDMGGGISAVAVITIPDDITDIQFGVNCKVCKAHFWNKRLWAKYCSGRCRTRAWRARRKLLLKIFGKDHNPERQLQEAQ